MVDLRVAGLMVEAVTGRVLQRKLILKFRKFRRKTPALESLFNKVTGLS